jgi:hypothetical protein
MGEEAGAEEQLRKLQQQRADDLEMLHAEQREQRAEYQAGLAALNAKIEAGQVEMREEIARLDAEIAAVRARTPEAIASELGCRLRSMAVELEAVLEPQQLRLVMDIAQRCVTGRAFAPTCCVQG